MANWFLFYFVLVWFGFWSPEILLVKKPNERINEKRWPETKILTTVKWTQRCPEPYGFSGGALWA